jgi:hypothetical protein
MLLLAVTVLLVPQASTPQHTPPTQDEVEGFAERVTRESFRGKQVQVPTDILRELSATAPDDYAPCDQREKNRLEAHEISAEAGAPPLLALQGRGLCYCSPTGNCSFWLYEHKHKTHQLILEIDMVQSFGFLKSKTHGYPNLVTWSHGSATDSSANLFRFDGTKYVASGGWEIEFQYLDENGNLVQPDRARITSHFWGKDTVPR